MQYELSKQYPEKRAFLTGAGSGLGKAIAEELSKDCWTLGVVDINEKSVHEIASIVEGNGGKAFPFVLDVADKEAYEKVANDFISHVGIDVLFNNAGVGDGGVVGEYALKDWEWLLSINLNAVIYGCHYFIPTMKEQFSGMIINTASAAAFANAPKMAAYNVSKAGVLALSETLKAELHWDNIKVSAITPTFFETGIMDKARGGDDTKEMGQLMIATSNLSPEEVARHVLKEAGKGTFQIYAPKLAKRIHWIKRFFPKFFMKMKIKGVNKEAVMKAKLESKLRKMKKG